MVLGCRFLILSHHVRGKHDLLGNDAPHFLHVVIEGSTNASSNVRVLPDFTNTDFSLISCTMPFKTVGFTFRTLSFWKYLKVMSVMQGDALLSLSHL